MSVINPVKSKHWLLVKIVCSVDPFSVLASMESFYIGITTSFSSASMLANVTFYFYF